MDWPNLYLGPGPTITTLHPECIGRHMRTNGGDGTWNAANLAYFIPFTVAEPITAVKMICQNGTIVNGNLDMGIYDPTGVRLVSMGSTAQAGVNTVQELDIADTIFGPGLFYLALAMDNNVGRFWRWSLNHDLTIAMGCLEDPAGFPLPAVAALAASATGILATVPWIGLTTRPLV